MGCDSQEVIIDLGDGVALKKWQAIAWDSDDKLWITGGLSSVRFCGIHVDIYPWYEFENY